VSKGSGAQALEVKMPGQPVVKVEKVHPDEELKQADVVTTGTIEQRKQPRYAVDAWAEVMLRDATLLFRGRVLNISLDGCFVATKARLRIPRETPVEISFRSSNRILRCDASIKMVLPTGAGFRFEKMDARTRQTIDALVAELAAVAQASTLSFLGNLNHADTRVVPRP